MSRAIEKSIAPCVGCRNNFYNGNNSYDIQRCWSLKSARLVKLWRIGWWTDPTIPGAFVQVKTYNCHHETGRYGFSKTLPSHAVEPVYLTRKEVQ